MKVLIKNMVCDRCNFVIRNVLDELQLDPATVTLGEVDFGDAMLGAEQLEQLRRKIESLGFELIKDKKGKLIENIKKHMIAFVQRQDTPVKTRNSSHLAAYCQLTKAVVH